MKRRSAAGDSAGNLYPGWISQSGRGTAGPIRVTDRGDQRYAIVVNSGLELGPIDDLTQITLVKDKERNQHHNRKLILWAVAGLLAICIVTICVLSVIAAVHGVSDPGQGVLEVTKLLIGLLGIAAAYLFGHHRAASENAPHNSKNSTSKKIK